MSTRPLRIINARTAEQWAEIIRSKWQNSVKGILDVGIHIANANEELGAAAWLVMVRDDLKYARSTAYQLMAVGKDVRLQESNALDLPNSWSILYDLTRLTDEQFEHGIKTGVIHAGMERKDIKQLLPPKEDEPAPPAPRLTGRDLIEQRTIETRQHIVAVLRELDDVEQQLEFIALVRLQLDDLETQRKQPA